MVPGTAPGEPLDLGTGVEAHPQVPAELVEHVPDTDVLRLAEDPVAALCEGYDLGVAPRRIEEGGVPAAGEGPPDLDMGDAVIHPDYRDAHHAGEGPCGRSGDAEAGPEPGAHRERDEADILGRDPCLVKGPLHLDGRHIGVVIGGLAGMEPSLRRAEHVELVREHLAPVIDDTYPQRVGRPLDPHRQHRTGPRIPACNNTICGSPLY